MVNPIASLLTCTSKLTLWLKFSRLGWWFQSTSVSHFSGIWVCLKMITNHNQFSREPGILDRAGTLGYPTMYCINNNSNNNNKNIHIHMYIYIQCTCSKVVLAQVGMVFDMGFWLNIWSPLELGIKKRTRIIISHSIAALWIHLHFFSLHKIFPWWSHEYFILWHLWHWKSMEHLSSIIFYIPKHPS